MFSLFRTGHKPTGVEICCEAVFTHPQARNLIVVKANVLEVYNVVGNRTDGFLELLNSFSLFGNIMDIAVARLTGNARDSLILAFPDACISIVDYDPQRRDLKTKSLHFLEGPDIRASYAGPALPPQIFVDPGMRCAVALVYARQLVVLPFSHEGTSSSSVASAAAPVSVTTNTTATAASMPKRRQLLASYILKLDEIDTNLRNIRSVAFLHGFSEPTLVIVYEPEPTWTGRLAMRKDTCSLVAVSLDVVRQRAAVIWTLTSLPYDPVALIPIPRPLGGLVFVACNELIYLNQSVTGYAASLNAFATVTTDFPMTPQEDVVACFDAPYYTLIAPDQILFALRSGELYVVTLISDGTTVNRFAMDKPGTSVLPSCVCTVRDRFIFLGSRLGDSLLFSYAKTTTTAALEEGVEALPGTDGAGAAQTEQADDFDDLDTIFATTSSVLQQGWASYKLRYLDSMINIGPIAWMSVGEVIDVHDALRPVDGRPVLEYVCGSGHGKNGALSIVRRSVLPSIVGTFHMEDYTNLWAVYEGDRSTQQGLLVLSGRQRTLVLRSDNDAVQVVTKSPFYVTVPTVLVTNVLSNRYVVQVCPRGLYLFKGSKEVQSLPQMAEGDVIVDCHAIDPYLVVRMQNGRVRVIVVEMTNSRARFHVMPFDQGGGSVISANVYCDRSGLFVSEAAVRAQTEARDARNRERASMGLGLSVAMDLDDDDAALYGLSEPVGDGADTSGDDDDAADVDGALLNTGEPTYWLQMCRENGAFEIFSLPALERVFSVGHTEGGAMVLNDTGGVSTSGPRGDEEQVAETLLVAPHSDGRRPILLVLLASGDLVMYEAFVWSRVQNGSSANSGNGASSSSAATVTATGQTAPAIGAVLDDSRLAVAFFKIEHDVVLHRRETRDSHSEGAGEATEGERDAPSMMETGGEGDTLNVRHRRQLRTFTDINGYSGVFLCDEDQPLMIVVPRSKHVRLHPFQAPEGGAVAAAAFNHANCPHGFVFLTRQGALNFAMLPSHNALNHEWPTRKVNLRRTPVSIDYHLSSKKYALITVQAVETQMQARPSNDEEWEEEPIPAEPRLMFPTEDKFQLELVTPKNWSTIHNYEFPAHEFVTSAKVVNLLSEETVSGFKEFVAVATSSNYGEEVTVEGFIYVFGVNSVVAEADNSLTDSKLRLLVRREFVKRDQTFPVTAINSCNGYLVTAANGQRAMVWRLAEDNEDIEGMAFLDTQAYIHRIVSLKRFIILADSHSSITLVMYNERGRTLAFIGRDFNHMVTYAVEFMVNDDQLAFLATDENKNAVIFHYDRHHADSMGGQKLIRVGDIHIGAHVNTILRLRCAPVLAYRGAVPQRSSRFVSVLGTLDGGVCSLLPLPESTYRRLQMLHAKLTVLLPHRAGLNPKSYRLARDPYPHVNREKNIVDGDLLARYLHLPLLEQRDLARQIGSQRRRIIDDLRDAAHATLLL